MIAFRGALLLLVILCVYPAQAARAQSALDGTHPAGSGATLAGDTGLWFVPAAEVLPAGVLDASVSVASEPRADGATRASYGAASAARGIADRAEVFGSWHMTTAIDGHRGRGDLLAGTKIGLWSERRGAPIALAARGVVKLPTGDDAAGSGKADLLTEIVASRRLGRAEITGASGVIWRGDPDGENLPNGVRSGIGVAVAAHRSVRVFTEVHGEARKATAAGSRLVSAFDTPTTAAAGLTWRLANGLSASAGINRAIGGREDARGIGAAVRLGYRPGASRPPSIASAPAGPVDMPATSVPLPGVSGAGSTGGSSSLDFGLDDVHFDFDRHTLRPESLPILDRAVSALGGDPSLHLKIDGHTCEVGTTEYNLALAERRAHAVRDYLVHRGIVADRLQTVSFGEERPKHGTSTEEMRALNRRAELHPVSVVPAGR